MAANVDHRQTANPAQAGQGGGAAPRKPHSATARREPPHGETVAVCDPAGTPAAAGVSARRAPKLDARLRAAADWVTPCQTCADIGCDHGRLGAALLLENRCQSLLAADASPKALGKARKLLAAHALTGKAVLAAADGLNALDALPQGKADTVCILGMGGDTVAGILQRGQTRLQGATLVLGAQTELPLVRETVMRIGYRFAGERVVQADRRLYVLMLCTPAQGDPPRYTARELLLGPCLLQQLPAEWKPWLLRRQRLLTEAIAAIRAAKTPDGARLAKLRYELTETEETLRAMPNSEPTAMEETLRAMPNSEPSATEESRPAMPHGERCENMQGGDAQMTVQEVWAWLDRLAPFERQEAFDNAGLVLGDPAAKVTRVLFALDATLPVVREAVSFGAELIVTHHPLLFTGVKQIRVREPEGAVLCALLSAGISLIAAHTNWDQAAGGTGDSLATALGLAAIKPVLGSVYLRTGELREPISAYGLLGCVNERLSAHARLYGDPNATVRTVAVGAGALGDEVAQAAATGAQAYVVGEIKHHELLAAQALGLAVLETGHHQTEQPGIVALYQRFLSDAQTGRWPVTARLTAIQPYGCTTR